MIKQEIKGHFYRGTEFFSSAEYFGQSGRIILERVGNTAGKALDLFAGKYWYQKHIEVCCGDERPSWARKSVESKPGEDKEERWQTT